MNTYRIHLVYDITVPSKEDAETVVDIGEGAIMRAMETSTLPGSIRFDQVRRETEILWELDLDTVLSIPVVGNAYSDYYIWQMLHSIAKDTERPLSDRARAIRRMDVLTGVPESEGIDDMELVTKYMLETAELESKGE